MPENLLWTLALVVGGPIAIAAIAMWSTRDRRRAGAAKRTGGGGVGMGGVGGFGVIDEIFHPNAKDAREIWEAQTELPAPAPIPGDRPDLDAGRITIVLPADDPAEQHKP